MLKRMQIALLFSIIITILAGCLTSPDYIDTGISSNITAQQETVSLLSFPDQPKEYFKEAIEHAGINANVNVLEVPQNQYEDKVHLMLMAREATDLILMDSPNIASYAVTGVLEPLDTYWDKEDFNDLLETTKNSVRWDGHIWASPLNESSCLLFYNRRLFEEAGITAPTNLSDAWDLNTLLDVAKRLTKKDRDGNITQYGILPSMFAINNRNEGMAYTQMLYLWWFGGDILSPDGTTASGYFDSPQSIDAIRYYGELFYKHKVAPSQEIVNGFVSGKIAMWINGPWLLGVWKDNFPEFYDGGWGVMPLPRGIESASPTGSWNIAITKQSTKKDVAWSVIKAITGKDGMRIWCKGTGNIPARKSILENDIVYDTNPVYQIIREQLNENSRSRPITPAYPDISEAIIDCFNSVAHGEDVEPVVEEAVKKINKSLEVFNRP